MSVTNNPNSRAALLHGMIYSVTVVGYLWVLTKVYAQPYDSFYQVLQIFSGALTYLFMRRYELTVPWRPGRPGSIGTQVLIAWAWVVGVLTFIGFFSRDAVEPLSRLVLLTWFTTTPVVLMLLHLISRYILRTALPEMAVKRSAVIVFANDSARVLQEKLQLSNSYDVLGYFDDREADRTGGGIPGTPLLGKARSAAQYVKDHNVQVVFVVLPDSGSRRALRALDDLGDTTASLYYVPDFFMFSLMNAKVSEIEGVPVLQVAETPFYGVDGLLKRVFDLVFASVALIMLIPVLLGIGIAVKLSSPGPALFKQKRYGLNGTRFWVYKFRSMVVNSVADTQQASRNDNRITRVGRIIRKTSLDELPQFWNVIKGEMSVVGPRPHPVALNENSRKEVKRYMLRHKVKPGVTGWAQVNGLRGETANIELMEERIRFDLDYIRNWSPWFDIKIIVRTVVLVFRDDMAF